MEPVQRLIIGNNVYDANDDELEAEVTPYLSNLVQKEKTAKDGKAAIITSTQNKTGKPITTNTYAEVVDKISKIKAGTFKVPKLIFRSKFATYVNTFFTEVLNNKVVRFSNWDTLTEIGNVAFMSKYSREVLHKPPNTTDEITFSMQVNLDFCDAVADLTPIFEVSENNDEDANITISKVDNTSIKVKYVYDYNYDSSEYDVVSVQDMSNFNYFGVDIKCLANQDKITINMYAGSRQSDETAVSGYVPSNKVLLFSRTYDSRFDDFVLVTDIPITVSVCGNEHEIEDDTTYAQTALHINDFGVRLVDPYKTSVVGNTNFLDMEVTS